MMFLKCWLALARTRLFVAVTVPACVGGAVAFADGFFSWDDFALVLFGLIMAEVVNLFLGDWSGYKGIDFSGGKATPPPVLEGSPTLPERLLPLKYAFHAAIACAFPAVAVFIYFAWQLGWPILALVIFAMLTGAFYVAPPFRYAFFSTAFLPPIIAFGAYYVLSHTLEWRAFFTALPILFIAAGVIYTYRVVYEKREGGRFEARRKYIKLFYSLCYLSLLFLMGVGLVSTWALLGLLSLPLVLVIERVARAERADYLPATSLGVMLHSTTGVLIALGYSLSKLL